jgi:hypothetical protein
MGNRKEAKEKLTSRRKPGYDKPRDGYVRYCTYVNQSNLAELKLLAKKEGKTVYEAINEAIENWVNYEPND